jgi:succinate-semialdehyde dehydrogenase / glutarate-semialdehyde dehydrogenase
VQSGVLDEFTARLQKRVAALKVGNGLEQGTDIGPLINAAAVKKVSYMHVCAHTTILRRSNP